MMKNINYDERAERTKLILELYTIADNWLEIDCAISSVILGTIAALKAGVSHELAVYLLDFSKACMNPEMKKRLIHNLNLIERQKQLIITSAQRRPIFVDDITK